MTFSGRISTKLRSVTFQRLLSTSRSVAASKKNDGEKLSQSSQPEKSGNEEPKPLEFRHDYSVLPDTYSYTTEMNEDNFLRFPLVTAKKLARRKERPRNVRMLSRDFIDGMTECTKSLSLC